MGMGQEGDQEAWGMPMSLGPERGSVDRIIREDRDAEAELVQLGLVVLVSDRRKKAVGEWGGVCLCTPEPPSHSFSRAPRLTRSQICRRCSVASS